MAQISGTTDTLDIASGGGIREDLEDVIQDLFPGDTWCLTNLETVTATNTLHEWLTDALAGATANRQVEGDDAAYTTIVAATRMGNYQQISRKTFLISKTVESVKKAGRKSEIARQAIKQMRELKRDMEQALIGNQASSAGGNTTARSTGSMESWIASTDHGGNAVRTTTTASCSTVGFSGGVVVTPTDGTTTAALTVATLISGINLAWAQGGDPSVLLVGATQKAAITAFTGIAQQTNEVHAKPATVVQSVSVFVSDYGLHKVVLHRYIRASVVLGIDPDYWAISYLEGRRPSMEALAKTGDGEKRMLITEYGLVARNPLSSFKVAGCA